MIMCDYLFVWAIACMMVACMIASMIACSIIRFF
jgi:hypothetical protein